MHSHSTPHHADPDRLDLSALDPDIDGDAADRLVRNVRAGCQQRYPAAPELLMSVWTTSPRALLGVLAVAATVLVAVRLTGTSRMTPPTTVAESIGVPPEFLDRVAQPRGSDR